MLMLSILLNFVILESIAILKMLILYHTAHTYLSTGKLFLQRWHLLGLRLLVLLVLTLTPLFPLLLLIMI